LRAATALSPRSTARFGESLLNAPFPDVHNPFALLQGRKVRTGNDVVYVDQHGTASRNLGPSGRGG
jgi:hypothetical protein